MFFVNSITENEKLVTESNAKSVKSKLLPLPVYQYMLYISYYSSS